MIGAPTNTDIARVQDEHVLAKIIEAYYPLALNGNERAASIVMTALERRAKLLGTDAPERHEVSHSQPPTIVVNGATPPEELNEVDDGGDHT